MRALLRKCVMAASVLELARIPGHLLGRWCTRSDVYVCLMALTVSPLSGVSRGIQITMVGVLLHIDCYTNVPR